MSKHKSQDRKSVELADPRPGQATHISRNRAYEHCAAGLAYFLKDGRLKFRQRFANNQSRSGSDVYVQGVINWRGEEPIKSFHKPGEVRC